MIPAVQALITLSQSIGQQLDLVQGGGGNTSVKADGVLYIKASGTPLKDMSAERGWVSLNHRTDGLEQGQRPSMEWPMHQALRATWVCHTHSVYLNVFSCMDNGDDQLKKILTDFDYATLPYVQPGQLLAQAIQQLPYQPEIIILKNHGLLIATASASRALHLTQDIHQRCAQLMPRPFHPASSPLSEPIRYYFPDAAVLSMNQTVLAANQYIEEMIQHFGGTPEPLTLADCTALRAMNEEQYRRQLNR